MLTRYGKKYGDIAKIKKNYLHENDRLLANNDRIKELYSNQPKRKKCKICSQPIEGGEECFVSHGLTYYVCGNCGHINGEYEETHAFTNGVYEEGDYAETYDSQRKEEYNDRVERVYIPKAKFLLDALTAEGEKPSELSCLDVGAGSGYFVNALLSLGLDTKGIEISSAQVKLANQMSKKECVCRIPEESISDFIDSHGTDVVSFVGVLEHMLDPHEALKSVINNKKIKYIFFSVPTLSYSVVWEAIFGECFNRHLGGGHTHIFTNDSIDYLCKQYGFNKVAEWRFGGDAADLCRMIDYKLISTENDYLEKIFHENYYELLDDFQLLMDKQHLCSETHIVAQIRR